MHVSLRHQKEQAAKQHDHLLSDEAPDGERHDEDLEGLDEAHHPRLVVLVGQLPAGGRQEHERQDEDGADDQAGLLGREPRNVQLVGDEHRERELQDVVVAGAEELGPEERRESALLQERELAGMGLTHGWTGLRTFCRL